MDGSRTDPEVSAAAADGDAIVASSDISRGGSPTPDEYQNKNSDADGGLEAGQIESEVGMIDGEMDAEVDLDVVA